jgi:hypothetical protein
METHDPCFARALHARHMTHVFAHVFRARMRSALAPRSEHGETPAFTAELPSVTTDVTISYFLACPQVAAGE